MNPLLQRVVNGVTRRVRRRGVDWADADDVLGTSRPRDVGTEIINICNADCSFCGYGKGPDGTAADPRVKQRLDLKVFRHTLALYSAAGGGMFTLSPVLGEVSVDKRWLDLVREARTYPNITGVSCYTNGILLHRFGAKNILQSGLTHMNISTALGSREQYRRLYGVDSYEQVVQNILDILRTNRELGHPVDVTLLLRIDKPFERFYASELYRQITDLLPREKIQILDDEWDDFKGLIQIDGIPAGHRFRHVPPDRDMSKPCSQLYRKLEVLVDGTIQGCACRVEPELWTGNILEYKTLEEAFRNPKLELIRTNWLEGTIPSCCRTCSHYHPFDNLLRRSRRRGLRRYVDGVMRRMRGRRSAPAPAAKTGAPACS